MISVVIPTLNEAENLQRLIPGIYKSLGGELEVLVVDKSTDNTSELVYGMMDEYPGLRYCKQKGSGFANALVQGIAGAKGDIIVTMDAENHLPREIPELIYHLGEEHADVVIGSRFMAGAWVELEKKRMMSSKIGSMIINAALKLKIKDCSSGFRAYRASAVKPVLDNIRTKYFSIQVELLEKINENGGKLFEVPISYVAREDGESKFAYKPAMKDGATLLKIAGGAKIRRIKERIGKVKKRRKTASKLS
ncbi:MAG: hypothetical protein MSIBF_03835 [Candidatus Altiarchaeales archaeon IMC4]|nr:MAG: hypothetical protein MSIBF_03835 [Candidatus Altiarchaeales archaeon IMC4]